MLEKFKKNVLSNEQMKIVKGGVIETWDCWCETSSGTRVAGFNGYGSNGDFRDDVIEAGCSNYITYCYFNNVE